MIKSSADSDGEFGEFEDLQTGEVFGRHDDSSDVESIENDGIDEQLRAINAQKKAKSILSKRNKDEV